MAAALLLFVIAASFMVVRIGAAALELTGMSWERAKFQALSAFTNAGFTSRESEEVMRHPVRRRIAAYLIILGNAGLVSTIGTFAGSVIVGGPIEFLINLAAIIAGLSLLLWLARKPRLAQRIRDAAQHRLRSRYGDFAPAANELLRLDEGYTLTRVTLPAASPAVGRSLAELGLKDRMVQVLAIERDGTFQPIPKGDLHLQAGDELIVYGLRHVAQQVFKPSKTRQMSIVSGAPSGDENENENENEDENESSSSASPP